LSEIAIPAEEYVATSSLKVDGKNPNKLNKKGMERLKKSIQKFGFIVPIITNKDLLIADGEQRWTAAQELGMAQVKIIRLPVSEVDRHLIRQVMNKLRGEHDDLLDAEEFQTIINDGGSGTTLIAAEQTSRICYMMELMPAYCELTCRRWEKLTGKKRELIKNSKTGETPP